MSKTPVQVLLPFYEETIAAMPATFTAHQFILHLARNHQREYIQVLAAYAASDHPFKTVHGQLARRLLGYTSLIRKTGDDPNSRDIFGQSESASVWEKVS